MPNFDTYETSLASRYPSKEMKALFSARTRYSTWRQLWCYLAEAEKELGVEAISDEALAQMNANTTITDESFQIAAEEEKRRRHDVMAHVYAFSKVAPKAEPIIHLGATSCFVTDNSDLIFLRNALDMILPKLAKVIYNISQLIIKYKDLPTLGLTHYQSASLITLGKRFAQWAQELAMDLEDIEYVRSALRFRGAQGATGTQASFLEVFQGDSSKVDQLNEILCRKAGFPSCYDISTQTYTRKVDCRVADAISSLGATAMRIATDIRHMAHDKILDEPFEANQIGSSTMMYKRNPMRSERICSLGRKLKNLSANFKDTFAEQWFERTLDDSAIRRSDIPEMFLLADAILLSLDNVSNGIVVWEAQIREQIAQELPFMLAESVMLRLVAHGISRQEAHEQIRILSHESARVVKGEGGRNDLIERIKQSDFFKPVHDEIDAMMNPSLYVGRSVEICEKYAGPGGVLEAKLGPYREHINTARTAELAV